MAAPSPAPTTGPLLHKDRREVGGRSKQPTRAFQLESEKGKTASRRSKHPREGPLSMDRHQRCKMKSSAKVFSVALALVLLLQVAIRCVLAFNLADDVVEVFDDPTRGNGGRGSYFGFSVGLQRQMDGSYRLLVGAPRANSTVGKHDTKNITEPGAVFGCDINQPLGGCKEIILDPTGNDPVKGSVETRYHDLKNFGWLGGSMDIHPEGRNATAVCAPRFKNQRFRNTYQISGACYWYGSSFNGSSANRMVPLTARSKQTFFFNNGLIVFNHAHGQAGFSVHFPDVEDEFLLGAPGVFNWKGTVIRARDGPGHQVGGNLDEMEMYNDFFVPSPKQNKELDYFSLFGYSVTSGRFSKRSLTYYVAGAPRGANFVGQVFIFLLPLNESHTYNISTILKGQQLGEYFGAAVAALDFNNDGLDDLVIGAPTHTLQDAPDVGRVYVFGNKQETLVLSSVRYTGSEVAGARFGTTVMAPGDLNKDGFDDLLVGAPYENEGEGAVYVYCGSSEGLRPTFSQRLSPSGMRSSPNSGVLSASSSLRGFGMSISRGADVDANGYDDVAIGSYLSGQALIVRVRSVAELKGHLSTSPKRLRLEDKEFVVSACITYSGFQVPDSQEVLMRLALDVGVPTKRALFDSGVRSITYSTNVKKNTLVCRDHLAKVALRLDVIADLRKDIELQFEYRLASDGPFEKGKVGSDALRTQPSSHSRTRRQLPPGATQPPRPSTPLPQMSKTLPTLVRPITDPYKPSFISDRISIITGCEDGGRPSCESDLVVDATFDFKDHPTFEIGSPDLVTLHLAVSNLGEPAFLPNLTVVVPHPVDLVVPTSIPCNRNQEEKIVILVCFLAGPIKNDTSVNMEVALDMSALTDASDTSIEVNVTANSAEREKNPSDNFRILRIDLKASADLWLHGVAEEEQVIYSRLNADTINTTDIITTHAITIVKHGPTPLQEVTLEIEIPVNISSPEAGDHNFAQIFIEEAQLMGRPFQCQLEGAFFADDASEEDLQTGNSYGENYDLRNTENEANNDTEYEEVGRRRRYINAVDGKGDGEIEGKDGPRKVVIWSGWGRVSRALMTCHIIGWPMGPNTAKLTFIARLNMTVLSQLIFASKGADFVTTVRARVALFNPSLPFDGAQSVSENVTTRVIPGIPPAESVPWWILLLAVLAGLFLLCLLTLGLYKIGFFCRKKRNTTRKYYFNTME